MSDLVVFFSRDGHTEKVAEALAEKIDADIESIKESGSREGVIGWVRSGYESARGKSPPIRDLDVDPGEYDLVVVGTPVWAGNLASPVRSFLDEYGSEIKKVGFFCTMGGDDPAGTFEEMQELCGKPPVAVAGYKSNNVDNDSYLDNLDVFIEKLVKG
ncbi:flavodoxin [Candidatus Bathyarchaeota archaeon]|nr:flavodoxin [Candidatus Bathyarchaeota archaeon]